MANRTLQFYGYAYGNAPVELHAELNGQVVFSGTVPAVDQPLPLGETPDLSAAPVLFTVADCAAAPTTFAGSLPMTVKVNSGNGIVLGEVHSNYNSIADKTVQVVAVMENSTIADHILTVGTLVSGTPAVGQYLWAGPVGSDVNLAGGAKITGDANAPAKYYVTPAVNVSSTTIQTLSIVDVPGNATNFASCYSGTPANSDNTACPRSDVTIDGVAQSLDRAESTGTWTWVVPEGSTIAYNLNISAGSE
jgi:hypothetical protein